MSHSNHEPHLWAAIPDGGGALGAVIQWEYDRPTSGFVVLKSARPLVGPELEELLQGQRDRELERWTVGPTARASVDREPGEVRGLRVPPAAHGAFYLVIALASPPHPMTLVRPNVSRVAPPEPPPHPDLAVELVHAHPRAAAPELVYRHDDPAAAAAVKAMARALGGGA